MGCAQLFSYKTDILVNGTVLTAFPIHFIIPSVSVEEGSS